MYIYTNIYVCISVSLYMCMCIYIYIEREIEIYTHMYIYSRRPPASAILARCLFINDTVLKASLFQLSV